MRWGPRRDPLEATAPGDSPLLSTGLPALGSPNPNPGKHHPSARGLEGKAPLRPTWALAEETGPHIPPLGKNPQTNKRGGSVV